MNLDSIEADMSASLATPVLLSFANSATAPKDLVAAERQRVEAFRFENRKRDWLCGRLALKPLLKILGRPADSTAVHFPDEQVSLSHGEGQAFAVATPSGNYRVGIDYERLRDVNPRIASWYLNESEIEQLRIANSSDLSRHLIRLWTIKEAAFKCQPNNRGMALLDFAIADTREVPVHTITTTHGETIHVACRQVDQGFLSVAVYGDSNEN